MAKYRKKPVVVEAVQFDATKESFNKILSLGLNNWTPGEMGSQSFYIKTLEGNMKVSNGDYVVKGVNGEFYPIKESIFVETYDFVEGD